MKDNSENKNGSDSKGQPVEAYIDKLEVGRRLGASLRTIDGWMQAGLIPYYKMKRSVRFKWSEVEQQLGACRVAGPKAAANTNGN
jgi:excisionase family DNA binding protein